jgi:DNA mismatch repair protein MutL
MVIRILSDEVASQIAAGEVVERPASVVKELLENGLDAGATEISDNGTGMNADDLPLAVARHATSKLSSADDLFHIHTLGFRGEALASIGSVARLSISTRVKTATVGARLQVDGGKVGTPEQHGVPVGTSVRVEDIFFNVPARLKFLKKDITERRQVDELVTRYALAYPHVRVQLFQDGKPVLMTSGNGKRREVMAQLYGVDVASQMLEIILDDDDHLVEGFISPVALTRSNRRDITFFVNGRWVQDISLVTALLQAYRNLLMVGRFPLSILFLTLPVEDVDVNVHPAKAEVRFRNPDGVFSLVQRAVRRGLLAYSPVPQMTSVTWSNIPANFPPASPQSAIDPAWDMARDAQTAGIQSGENADTPSSTTMLPTGQLPLLRLVGQIGGTYIIAEAPDGLYLIDQHAAHERVLYERFLRQRGQKVTSQPLLEPLVVQLPPQQSRLLEEQLGILNNIGFQVELFGPGAFRVGAIPAIFTQADPAAALRAVVEDFEEDEEPLKNQLDARLIARICKRVAVKGGQVMSTEEQRALVQELEICQAPRTCPHGRPTMIHLSVDLLERQFGRRGSR